jgi:hypothetical protein
LLSLGGQLDLYGLQLLLQGSHVAWSGNRSRRETGRASSGYWACVLSILAQASDKIRVELIDGQWEIGQVFGQDILKVPTRGDGQFQRSDLLASVHWSTGDGEGTQSGGATKNECNKVFALDEGFFKNVVKSINVVKRPSAAVKRPSAAVKRPSAAR